MGGGKEKKGKDRLRYRSVDEADTLFAARRQTRCKIGGRICSRTPRYQARYFLHGRSLAISHSCRQGRPTGFSRSKRQTRGTTGIVLTSNSNKQHTGTGVSLHTPRKDRRILARFLFAVWLA